ncbi:MAG: hypothetical protein ACK4PR_12955, partial [Gammaproteobacteria bacterium]
RYIAQHFDKQSSTSQQTELTQLVKTNANIQGIAVIPVNMEILCIVAEGSEEDIKDLAEATVTQIYVKLSDFILKRYYEKGLVGGCYCDWDKNKVQDAMNIEAEAEAAGILPCLRLLAKNIFVQSRLLFSDGELTSYIRKIIKDNQSQLTESVLKRAILGSGFIAGLRLKDDGTAEGQGYFLHLTIQEYLTAWWCAMELVGHAEQELKPAWQLDLSIAAEEMSVEQLIAKYKYHPFYALVWPFVAGILTQRYAHAKQAEKNKYRDALVRFIELIEGAPSSIVGKKSHDVLLLSCMSQIGRRISNLPHQWLQQAQKIFEKKVRSQHKLVKILAQAYEIPCREWVKESYKQIVDWISRGEPLPNSIISTAGVNEFVLLRLKEIIFNQSTKYIDEICVAGIRSLGQI